MSGNQQWRWGRTIRSVNVLTARYPKASFAILAIVAFAFIGFAVDHSNQVMAKANLQEALETAALSVLPEIETKSDDEVRRSLASIIEEKMMTEQEVSSLSVAVDRKSRRLRCRATVKVETTVTSLIGPEFVEVAASTDAGQ